MYLIIYSILAFSSEAFATSRYLRFQKCGQMGKEKRAEEIHTLTTVGSHLLFVNSDMWLPIMTFKLGNACTKLTQRLWSPWVGDEQVLWRWDAFLSKGGRSLYSKECSGKLRTFQRVHCRPFWKADRLTIFLTPYKPQVVPEESCVAADFWQ